MKKSTAVSILSVMLLACGCATTDKIVYDSTIRPATSAVDVFKDGALPTQHYKVIGELSYLGPRNEDLIALKQFIGQAKQMGGNGIIFTPEYAGVKGGGTIFQTTAWVFKGKVIVYDTGDSTIPSLNETKSKHDLEVELNLVGYWESISMAVGSVKTDVEKMGFDFKRGNHVTGYSFSKNDAPYRQDGIYSVKGNTLIISSSGTKTDMFTYSLTGDQLVLTLGTDKVVLKKSQ